MLRFRCCVFVASAAFYCPLACAETGGSVAAVGATTLLSADKDGDGVLSLEEFAVPAGALGVNDSGRRSGLFRVLDHDHSSTLSDTEFARLGEAIKAAKRADASGYDPVDPGRAYRLFRGLRQSVDDGLIEGAVYHRHHELLKAAGGKRAKVAIDQVPPATRLPLPAATNTRPATLPNAIDATLVISGGRGEDYFSSGAVLVSQDGLALTNYHVARSFNQGLTGATADGKCYRVVEFLAGHEERDVALVRLEGKGFPFVPIAPRPPAVGENLALIHHSESRYYTYSRGYVMRYPRLFGETWMEVSADYAPGGSGCGIFNERHELVGLVCMVSYGYGPDLAVPDDQWADDPEEGGGAESANGQEAGSPEATDEYDDGFALLVKHAVPLSAIRSLWAKEAAAAGP